MRLLPPVSAILPAMMPVLFASPAFADPQGYWGYGYGHPMMGYGWFFGPLFMILTIVLIVVAVVLVLRWLGIGGPGAGAAGTEGAAGTRSDPLEILKERLARGEITPEEYEERKRVLGA